jgi:hypothetical protein
VFATTMPRAHRKCAGQPHDAQAPGKDSQRLKRKTAGWDDDFLASLIAA